MRGSKELKGLLAFLRGSKEFKGLLAFLRRSKELRGQSYFLRDEMRVILSLDRTFYILTLSKNPIDFL